MSHGDDKTESYMANVTTPKTVCVPPVSRINLSISCEDNKKFMEVHVTAPRQNNAFLTENRPSLT